MVRISPEILRAISEQAEAEVEHASDIVRRVFGVSIKAGSLNEESRSVRVIASSAAIDSYDEIVDQTWDLERYQRNPVVLYNHNDSGGFFSSTPAEETLPIGFATDVAVSAEGRLEATLNFVDEKASPLAPMVWEGFRQGSIRAVSVGFRPNDVAAEKINGLEVYRLSNNELFEISVVPIGANPEAVAKTAANHKEQLRRMLERKAEMPAPKQPEAVDETTNEIVALRAANQALEERAAKAEAEAKALAEAKAADERERAKKSAQAAADAAVEKIVGKTIAPASKDEFVKLHLLSPDLFVSLSATLPPLGLMGEVVKEESITRSSEPLDMESANKRLAAKLQARKETE